MLLEATIPSMAPVREEERLDALIRADYERCHPDDTFDDLRRRARFSKEDRCLLRDWRALAKRVDRELQGNAVSGAIAEQPDPLIVLPASGAVAGRSGAVRLFLSGCGP